MLSGGRVGAVACAFAVLMTSGAEAASAPRIEVISNRADLVSGGDALVRITLPREKSGSGPVFSRVTAGRRNVTKAFAKRPNGKLEGLVTGLRNGRTTLIAELRDGRRAAITITNHPRGGPVFAGPQIQPWLCETDEHGLGKPRDAQCSVPTRTRFVYRPTTPGIFGFRTYDPEHPPTDIATTTTDQGKRVPFIVRVESGTMDRGIYNVAVLYDPGKPWTTWKPQPTWNGKVLWPFGGDCKPWHSQDAPVDATGAFTYGTPLITIDPQIEAVDAGADEALGSIFGNANAEDALARGYLVANSSMNKYGSTCNSVTSAEAIVMLKEEIAENYGPIRFTIGAGSSGGSMQQYQLASAYPGLLDGIQPMASFPDMWELVQEAQDCRLLNRYFTETSPALWTVPAHREAVLGTFGEGGCKLQFDGPNLGLPQLQSYSTTWMDPSNAKGCNLPEDRVYDPAIRPNGVRCTIHDYMVSVFGRRARDGFANRPYDNTGVQYGLKALQNGIITSEQFVDLNEKVGGLDIDWKRVPQRSQADLAALAAAYRGGLITHGRELRNVPIIDIRGPSNADIHSDFHTYVTRARLDRDNGTHGNQVVFTGDRPLVGDPTALNRAFELIDEWVGAIDRDTRPGSQAKKVVRNRPHDATDSCWLAGTQDTNVAECMKRYPYYADARIAAGGPNTDDVLKCALKPLEKNDYGMAGAVFTPGQWARLQAAFPDGVCDYTRPGAGQEPPLVWPTFTAGPGGTPLGPAPKSRRLSPRGGSRP